MTDLSRSTTLRLCASAVRTATGRSCTTPRAALARRTNTLNYPAPAVLPVPVQTSRPAPLRHRVHSDTSASFACLAVPVLLWPCLQVYGRGSACPGLPPATRKMGARQGTDAGNGRHATAPDLDAIMPADAAQALGCGPDGGYCLVSAAPLTTASPSTRTAGRRLLAAR